MTSKITHPIIFLIMVLLLFYIPLESFASSDSSPSSPLSEDNSGSATKGEKSGGDRAAEYQRVIAHGAGNYKGYETSNSVEALNNAISNGYKIIELDMEFSSDHEIIMLHDWNRTAMHYFGMSFPQKLSQGQFMSLTVFGELEVMTFDKLEEILAKHKDIRIITDTKGDNLKILTAISEKYPALVNRFIPQIYDYDQWSTVKELGYHDIILTLYSMTDPDAERIAAFARDHEIYAVVMPDYMADIGLCKKISGKGIVVYIHPVTNFEDALAYMRQGAFGVYSGSLLPGEFTDIEKDYYLTTANPDGSVIKLTDDRINNVKGLKLHGLQSAESVYYYLDDSNQKADNMVFNDLRPGKHKLTVKIYNRELLKGALTYYLWKDPDDLRILHKKYEYRLDAVRQEKDFQTVMKDENVSDEVVEILEHSLIAKEGEYSYYSNGALEKFTNGDELLPVQKEGFGPLLLPAGATLKKLGADSVSMDHGKDITIVYEQEKSRIMINSIMLRKGFRCIKLDYPVVLYLNKAVAGGDLYQSITGREYIEQDGRIVILPLGVKPDRDLKDQLIRTCGKLF